MKSSKKSGGKGLRYNPLKGEEDYVGEEVQSSG